MNFINKNIVMILSLVLAYAIIYFTADDLPRVIESLLGVHVEEDFFSKYKFPIAILAFLLLPIVDKIICQKRQKQEQEKAG